MLKKYHLSLINIKVAQMLSSNYETLLANAHVYVACIGKRMHKI